MSISFFKPYIFYINLYSLAAQSQLKQQSENLKNVDTNSTLKLEKLRKEKDEMLELAMHRGKLVQVNAETSTIKPGPNFIDTKIS